MHGSLTIEPSLNIDACTPLQPCLHTSPYTKPYTHTLTHTLTQYKIEMSLELLWEVRGWLFWWNPTPHFALHLLLHPVFASPNLVYPMHLTHYYLQWNA